MSSRNPQQNEDKGTEHGTPAESRCHEDKHKAPSSSPPNPLSLQDEETPVIVQDKGVDVVHSYAYDGLFTSWTVVILGYIALASTVFWPGYVVWMVWVVALRRFDRLSACAILLSCSALLYYPLLRLDPTPASILLPLCIFGIPLVYMIVQRSIPLGKVERKNVLT
jgi:hypothetical protein